MLLSTAYQLSLSTKSSQILSVWEEFVEHANLQMEWKCDG